MILATNNHSAMPNIDTIQDGNMLSFNCVTAKVSIEHGFQHNNQMVIMVTDRS